MSDPRGHHTVPRWLATNFASKAGKIYALRTATLARGVFESNPTKLFKRRDYYSALRADGTRDTQLETTYSQIEGRAKEIATRLLRASRDTNFDPKINTQDREAIDDFFYAQFTRTPEFHSAFNFDADFDEKLEEFVQRDVAAGRLTQEQAASVFEPENKEHIRQNARVVALGRSPAFTKKAMADLGLEVLNLRQTGVCAVLGSWPVVSFNGRPFDGRDDWASQMWLTLAPDVLLRYVMPAGKVRFTYSSDPDSVRRLNVRVARQSELVASHDRNILEDILQALVADNASRKA